MAELQGIFQAVHDPVNHKLNTSTGVFNAQLSTVKWSSQGIMQDVFDATNNRLRISVV